MPDKTANQNSNEQSIHGTISPEAALLSQQMSQQLALQNDDEIDLAELWRAIWAGKF